MIDSCRVMIKARQGDDVMQLVRAGGCGAAGLLACVCMHCTVGHRHLGRSSAYTPVQAQAITDES